MLQSRQRMLIRRVVINKVKKVGLVFVLNKAWLTL